ncbi:MAG: hypothetical protein R3297_04675, partial [Desulfobulbales bacterium]|nr:hypothetical protein [Desulfobulbales bacterium]
MAQIFMLRAVSMASQRAMPLLCTRTVSVCKGGRGFDRCNRAKVSASISSLLLEYRWMPGMLSGHNAFQGIGFYQ